MKKIFLPGLVAGLAMLVVGFIVSQLFQLIFPYLRSEYANGAIMRQWSDPTMLLSLIVPFIIGVILAWLWSALKELIKGGRGHERGMRFGIYFWIITLPGMIMSYSIFSVSLLMTVTLSISMLAQSICAGMILERLMK